MNLRNIKEVEKKKEKLDVFNKKRKKEAEFITEEEGSSKRKKGKVVQQNETDKEEEEEEEETVISSPIQRKEVETTETETEDSEVEDFPTEGLLQELHFLNASCERRHLQKGALSQVHKTPKKQRKLDFGSPSEESNAREENRSGSSSAKRKRSRKSTAFSPRKLDPDPSPKMKPSKISPLMKGEESEVYQNYNECYTSEDEEDDEGALTIVAHDESPKKRKGTSPPKSKKKMRGEEGTEAAGEVPQEVIELIQSGIDEMLEEKAERTHLTAIHVKNIIKNVMTDENVLAMVRNTVLGIPVGGSAGSAVYEPTLTRAKTRQLMEQQAAGRGQSSIWAGLSNHSPGAASIFTPETQALVSVDFPDEDEDEEYKPEADDQLHSDEESLVSASSPCTPSTMQSASTPGSHHSLNFPCSSSRSADIGTPSSQVPVVFKTPSVQEKSVQRVLTFDKEPKQERSLSLEISMFTTSFGFLLPSLTILVN
ncbi:hypothetical protein E2C01_000838 [Portunus trituberculatus]|uniref:Uncharacterized protein n=2 Tax=Portunus trituberculatus TaxID=210409 RepID=A0A5B7CFD7_PORTR|nr:hypothetical protein [Portunus trituberculatus]